MTQEVDADFKSDENPVNPFYSEGNIRYLERKKREIDEGKAHLSEHELIEMSTI